MDILIGMKMVNGSREISFVTVSRCDVARSCDLFMWSAFPEKHVLVAGWLL